MRINFFEEFPIRENLEKARMIDFPSTIFIAARSLQDFLRYKKELYEINPKLETAYWPIIPRTYWISPFSYTKDLRNFIREMRSVQGPLEILVDLELPLGKRWFLYFRNFFSAFLNKIIIKRFFKEAPILGIKIVTAEYPAPNTFFTRLYRILGISFDPKKYGHSSCVMYYTSMIPKRFLEKVEKVIVQVKKEQNLNLELGLGVISIGIMGNEPILPPQELARDLDFMVQNNFNTATIFRLGGLNQEYYNVIKPYTTSA